ncbi:MAG: hypothetical protein LBN02_07900 [Oscillospiraceae bacterium]|jgi:hypothetical protein|nr:hypothetical protein [Oscillospiraceae bacterium]
MKTVKYDVNDVSVERIKEMTMKKIHESTSNSKLTHTARKNAPRFVAVLVAIFMLASFAATVFATGLIPTTAVVPPTEAEIAALEEFYAKIESGEITPDDLSWETPPVIDADEVYAYARNEWETAVQDAQRRTNEPTYVSGADPDDNNPDKFADIKPDTLIEDLLRGPNPPTSIGTLPYMANGNFFEEVYTNYKFLPSAGNKIKVVFNGSTSSGICQLWMYLLDCTTGIEYGPYYFGNAGGWVNNTVTWINLDATHYWALKFVKTEPDILVSFTAAMS